METNGGILALIIIGCLAIGIFAGAGLFSNTEIKYVDKPIITEKLVEKDCPVCQNITIPKVENANNELLNEFLESEFEDLYNNISSNAEGYATEELEEDDYEVIVDYIKTLLAEGEELDESTLEVDIKDVDIEVTKLGLEEDEDKSATVEFEIKVKYELEEGVDETFRKKIYVVYEVLFDEGDFDDEEVTLVSIA